ncbi:MAG: M48 family metalloprotease, partial [Owenweeksia sp.]
MELGAQVAAEIESDPSYTILSRSANPASYRYLDSMVTAILNSGEVAYRSEFVWDVHIIQNDEVLNAFATPGGYIYVYTGLIKYLNNPDALAGVMGHEIAHADLRHTSRNLQKQYGVQFLLNLLLGENPSQLEQIAGQIAGTLAGLEFSREYETEADEKSVEYLAKTGFAC